MSVFKTSKEIREEQRLKELNDPKLQAERKYKQLARKAARRPKVVKKTPITGTPVLTAAAQKELEERAAAQAKRDAQKQVWDPIAKVWVKRG